MQIVIKPGYFMEYVASNKYFRALNCVVPNATFAWDVNGALSRLKISQNKGARVSFVGNAL